MIIQNITPDYSYYRNLFKQQNYNNSKINTKTCFTGLFPLEHDVLIKSLQNNPLNNFERFTIKEYLKLRPQQLQVLRKEYSKIQDVNLYNQYEITHDVTASCTKAVLDKFFGESNYVVIPIGRSLSSIGKVLGYKIGENNVKNIPLSNAKRYNIWADLHHDAYETKEIEMFTQYLKSIGLDEDVVKNSGKKYVLTDYCSTGYSLSGAKKLFKFIFGKDNENIFAFDITRFFDFIDKKAFLQNNKIDINFVRAKLESNLFCSKYKIFSTVNHCKQLSKAVCSEKDLSQDIRSVKLFRFKLLDNEMLNPESQRIPSTVVFDNI